MEVTRLFLIPPIKEAICQKLSFEDLVSLRDALGYKSLKCPIIITDPTSSEEIVLPGVNSETIEAYELIKKNGLNLALVKAAEAGLNLIVQILINAGADVDATNSNGWTALMIAIELGRELVAKTLIDNGANVNAITSGGTTPLMVASGKNQDRLIQMLIDNGADVNKPNTIGWTALMEASGRGHVEAVKTLLANRANVGAKTRYGLSALKVSYSYPEVTEILENAKLNSVSPK